MSLERFYNEGIEWSEIMKEIKYACAHMDFNKSYGCAKCDEERTNSDRAAPPAEKMLKKTEK